MSAFRLLFFGLCYVTASTCAGWPNVDSRCQALKLVTSPDTDCPNNMCTTDICCVAPTQCSQLKNFYCSSASAPIFATDLSCTSCNQSDCCVAPRTCNETLIAQSWFCSLNSSVFAVESASFNARCGQSGCTADKCCRPPQTCNEYTQATSNSVLCTFKNAILKPDQVCSGAGCANTSVCCRPPNTCAEAQSADFYTRTFCGAGYFWNSSDTAFFTSVCENNVCTQTRCCTPITTCSQAYVVLPYNFETTNCVPLKQIFDRTKNCTTCTTDCCARPQTCSQQQIADRNFCGNVNLTFDNSAGQTSCLTAPGGICTPQMCCRQPTNCYEANDNYVLSQTCRSQLNKVFLSTNSCTYPLCDSDHCCRDPQSCSELNTLPISYSFCDILQVFANENSCDQGVCTTQSCCRSAQTCSELISENYWFCSNQNMITNNSNETFFETEKCDNMTGCDAKRCCRLPQTCAETDSVLSFSSQCTQRSLADVTATSSCSVAANTCSLKNCCRPIAVCGDLGTSAQFSWCDDKYFDPSAVCSGGICTPEKCCRAPKQCSEFSYSLCNEAKMLSNRSGGVCMGGVCTVAQCCSAPQFCDDLQLSCPLYSSASYTKPCTDCSASYCCDPWTVCKNNGVLYTECRGLGMVVADKNCSGVGCNAATCCVGTTSCQDMFYANGNGNAIGLPCWKIGKVRKSNNLPCTGVCTSQQCCSVPQTCGDANDLSGGYLCFNRGVLSPDVACAGATCTPSTCCKMPSMCSEVRLATMARQSSLWCSQSGFLDSFDYTSCDGGLCTPAKCCLGPSNCNQWGTVQGRNGATQLSLCKDGVFNTDGSCPNGECDENSCCRPPVSCLEANFVSWCAINGTVFQDVPCSGAGCNVITCCKPAISCDPLRCAYAGLYPIDGVSSCSGGVCTNSQCCRAKTNCVEVQCPYGAQALPAPCVGSNCSVQQCCPRPSTCQDSFDRDYLGFCRGYGLIDSSAVLIACNGACSQAQCCRREPVTCGESYIRNSSFCGGAVDFFKSCTGSQCADASFCCRAAVNCGEAVRSGAMKCGAGQVATNLQLSVCPSGGCSVVTCCKAVATCIDANAAAAGTGLCQMPTVVLRANVSCGGGATPCTAQTCCRVPATCLEASANQPQLCAVGLEFDMAMSYSSCTSCATQCCRASGPTPANTEAVSEASILQSSSLLAALVFLTVK